MAQVTTGEVSFLVSVLVTTEFAVIGFFMRGLINDVKNQLKDMEKSMKGFQIEVAKEYRLKHECDGIVDRMNYEGQPRRRNE